MATSLAFRLRIRNASTLANPDGTADDLIVSSVAGGTNPYIRDEPTGDGQELDPLTGAVRAGAYSVMIVDAITSGTSRVFTSKLFDGNGRQQLLSRRAYIEISTNGGSTWPTVLIAGYVLGYRLADAITWEVQIGDTRRVEQNYTVFDGTSATFPKRGCLFGGPIIGGWGPVTDRGGWKFKVLSVTNVTVPGGTARLVAYQFQQGYRGVNDPLTNKIQEALGVGRDDQSNPVSEAANAFYSPSVAPYALNGYPGILARISESLGGVSGRTFTPCVSLIGNTNLVVSQFTSTNLILFWPATLAAPSIGDVHTIALYAQAVSASSPIYLTEHPVDLATKLLGDAGVQYDSASAATVRSALGDTLRVSMRITQSSTLLDFLQTALYGPFGFSARTNSSGKLEFFTTRVKAAAAPGTTINTNDLRSDGDSIFGADEATVIASVRWKSRTYYAYDPNRDGAMERPLDSVVETFQEVVSTSADVATFSAKEQAFEVPGMVHDAANFTPAMSDLITASALEIFDRFGHGAPISEVRLLRSSDTGLKIGDEVLVQPAHFPNLNKRYGDDNSVGARVMQVVRRTEESAGPALKLLDAGSTQQPVVPAAVITIAASTPNPRSVAQFTITNAAAINATAALTTVVEWATGTSSPAGDGTMFARYAPSSCPTVATLLPPVAPGTKVWVRARTEQDGRRASAWTAWTSVTLTAASAPTGLSITNLRQNGAQVNWSVAVATDLVDVYVAPGSVAPGDWTPYLIQTLPAGSTRLTVRGLSGPTVNYIAGVAHRDPATGAISTVATVTFTTNATLDTATRPAGIAIINTTQQDSGLQTGVAVALYPSDPAVDIVIERAPDVAGSPGAYTELAVVRGSQEVYVDRLPLDGTQRWYRLKHRYSGANDSTATCGKAGTPGAVPNGLQRPDPVAPKIAESFATTASLATVDSMVLTITDPQCRVDFVEKRTKVDPAAWSGFSTVGGSSPYTVTVSVPQTRFGWVNMRVWGWDAQGTYGVLFDDTASFFYTPIVEPAGVITIASNQSSSDKTAKASALINTPDNITSIKWLASNSAFPSQASVASTGTSVGGGSPFAIADLGVTLSFGDTVYLTVITLDANGVITGLYYNIKATRSNLSATKTMYFPWSQLQRYTNPLPGVGILAYDSTNDYVACTTTGGQANPQAEHFALSFILPDGATVTQLQADLFRDTNAGTNACDVGLYAAALGTSVFGGGTIASVSAPNTAAWSSQTASLSQSSTGKRFFVDLFLEVSSTNIAPSAGTVRFRDCSVTYLPGDLQATL